MTQETNQIVNNRLHESAMVLANASELAVAVIKRVAGNDISTAINGSQASREMLQNLLLRSMTGSVRQSVNKQA